MTAEIFLLLHLLHTNPSAAQIAHGITEEQVDKCSYHQLSFNNSWVPLHLCSLWDGLSDKWQKRSAASWVCLFFLVCFFIQLCCHEKKVNVRQVLRISDFNPSFGLRVKITISSSINFAFCEKVPIKHYFFYNLFTGKYPIRRQFSVYDILDLRCFVVSSSLLKPRGTS